MFKTAITIALLTVPAGAFAADLTTTNPVLAGVDARRAARAAALADAQQRRDLSLLAISQRAGELVAIARGQIPDRPSAPRLVAPTPRSPLDEAMATGGAWPHNARSQE